MITYLPLSGMIVSKVASVNQELPFETLDDIQAAINTQLGIINMHTDPNFDLFLLL